MADKEFIVRKGLVVANTVIVTDGANTKFDTDVLVVDGSNDRIGVNTASPSVSLEIAANDAILIPIGNTAQRPAAANGSFRYNTDDNAFEGYANGAWGAIGGASGLDDADIAAAASATNYTPTGATVDGHLAGIDTALGGLDDADIAAVGSATNYTPSGATVDGHLAGIDTALGGLDDADIAAVGSATNYTPTGATVDGHLAGIDTALATATTSAEGPLELATAAEYRNDTAGAKALTPEFVWDSMVEVGLSDSANIAVDMSTGFDFSVTLAGNRTLDNPTNTKVGQKGRFRVTQDATGSRTLAFGSNYEFAGGTVVTLTTTANADDILYYDVISSTRIIITSVLDIS